MEEQTIGKIHRKWNNYKEQILEVVQDKIVLDELFSLWDIPVMYEDDALNSLLIEGYPVTEEMIERTSSDNYSPEDSKETLVAKGYYLAHQRVMETIRAIVNNGENPALQIEKDLPEWYIELWKPFIDKGRLQLKDVVGYRNHPVYIKNSMHVPPQPAKILDYIDDYFDCLKNEDNSLVRAILGHFFFTWIHPYPDGNGRIARFIMNTLLVSAEYPWIVVPFSRKDEYLKALEKASVEKDIRDFARFIESLLLENG